MNSSQVEMQDVAELNNANELESCENISTQSKASPPLKKQRTTTVLSYFPGLNGEQASQRETKSQKKVSLLSCCSSAKKVNALSPQLNIEDFPLELLTHIFSYLNGCDFLRAITVNRLWRQAGSMREELDLSWCTKEQKQQLPSSFADTFRSLHTLNIGECNTPPTSMIKLLKNNSHSLSTIYLDNNSRFCDDMLKAVALYCGNLEILKWRNSSRIAEDTIRLLLGSEKGIKAYFGNKAVGCKKIWKLDVSYTKKMHLDALALIVKSCSLLTHLKVHHVTFIDHYLAFNNPKALSIIASCSTLKSLGFGGLTLSKDMQIQQESWKKLGSHLESINVSETNFCNGFEALIENCPNIRKLNVSYCKLSDAQLTYIIEHCLSLRELNIEGNVLSPQSAFNLPTLSTLTVLKCGGCWSEDVVQELKASMPSCTIISKRRVSVAPAFVSNERS